VLSRSCTCVVAIASDDQLPVTLTVAWPAAAAATKKTRTSTSKLLLLSGFSGSTVPLQKNKTASFPEIFFYVTTMICQDWFWTHMREICSKQKTPFFHADLI
jgi:hypothetical protein